MKLIKLTCPTCSAQLNIDIEDKIGFCQYCGSSLFVNDVDEKKEYVYRKIDEAAIKKVEAQTDIKQKELEHDFWKNKVLLCFLGVYALITLVFMIIALVSTLKGDEAGKYLWFFVGVLITLPIMVFLTSLLLKKDALKTSHNPIKMIVLLWLTYIVIGFIVFLLVSGNTETFYMIILAGIVGFELFIVYKMDKK